MHYLSHHPVIRTDKSTSRVRIVYDASAKRDGPSLNDCLETGPNTLPQIIDILLRFRLNKIALISDIKQAFLNVSIPESDRDFLRFLWVNDINSNETEIIIRRFTRVAFGTTASQFLLASAISKHLSQYEKTDPLFVEKLLKNLYVDNSINGGNSIEEAYHFYKKSKDCLLKGGFELRKFHSNNPSLQQKINQIENVVEPIQSEGLKVLGIEWDKFKDTFIIDLHKIFTNGFNSPVTKRNILRLITSIYDPLGIISPIVVLFKIYFQKLTTLKNNWDTDLNLEMSSEWLKLFNSLQFSKFTVQRFYLPSNISLTDRKFDVHGFFDASKNA